MPVALEFEFDVAVGFDVTVVVWLPVTVPVWVCPWPCCWVCATVSRSHFAPFGCPCLSSLQAKAGFARKIPARMVQMVINFFIGVASVVCCVEQRETEL